MSVPSKCPRCDQPVRLPDGLSEQARVRCPLCDAEFSADEALAGAPPLVIVVDPGPSPAEPAQTVSAPESAGTEALAAAAAAPGADVAGAPTDEAGQAVAPATGGESVPDLWRKVDDAPQIELGTGAAANEAEDMDSAAFAGFGEREEPAEDEGAVDRLLSARRPAGKRREKSLARELIGAVIGGFVGLALGYYLLNYFGGERFHFVEVYLPGVQHTYGSWPFGPTAPSAPQDVPSPGGTPAGQPPAAPGQSGSAGAGSATPAGTTPPGPTQTPRGTQPSGAQPLGGAADPGSQPGSSGNPPGGTHPGAQAQPPESTGGQGSGPEPEPPSPPELGPIDAPTYTSDELKAALNEANTAFGCWECNSTGTITRDGQTRTCPRCKGDPNLELSPEAYDAFCRLAETVTFVAHDSQTPPVDERRATETLLEWVARAPGQLDMAGRFAIGKLQTADGGLQGILMAGTAGPSSEQNGLYGSMVQIAGIPSSFLVLSDRPLPFQSADQVVILGVAVSEPAQRVRGYSGSKPAAVWLGAAVKVTP